jgi:hypothetical protein
LIDTNDKSDIAYLAKYKTAYVFIVIEWF